LLASLSLIVFASSAAARVLAITPEQVTRLGIHTEVVQPSTARAVLSVLGRIVPAPDSRFPVSTPFAGTVKKLVHLEGESVRKGDPLLAIASTDLSAAQARLVGLRARQRMTDAAAARAKTLVDEGIAPASRAEEANAEASAAKADLMASEQVMALARHAPDGGYYLLAPTTGRIAVIDVAAGEQVTAMQPVLTIDTRQDLWAEGALPAASIGSVASGDSVTLEGVNGVTGTVVAVGISIDPHTRSATVRAKLSGTGLLVGGQTVRLSITRRAGTADFNVPRTAVVELKSGPAVFVARPGGFEPVPVRILARGAVQASITGALHVGDKVVVTGTTELKAVSLQE
jgi:cobalt-zinc-cadmium efflux system membrane fusion protein